MASQRQRLSFLFLLSFVLSATCQINSNTLPQVDLGYTVVEAQVYDSDFYSFKNIRYAEAPVGDLRFRAPMPAVAVNRTVNDGSQSVICPQASPDWFSMGISSFDPRENEDCLFLDVVVNQGGFDAREEIGVLPVLVWIHGGGYVQGDKSANSSGLLAEALKSTPLEGTQSQGMVFVAMNYRLGAFGFLSGSTLPSDGTSNAGLYDQRLALQWIQENINSFGGNPDKVTVMGESAGGGSIMHQITAYGGSPPNGTPFQRAIIQSPGFDPVPSSEQQEMLFQTFLTTANVTSIEKARALDSETLQAVNQKMVGGAPFGTFLFNPVVDGSFVPDLPGKLLLQGAYDRNLSLLLGHNTNEGKIFTNPRIATNADFSDNIRIIFPTISPSVLNYVTQNLYPPIFNDTKGRYPYGNNFERTSLMIAESIFTCNTNYLARAYNNQTYNYLFSTPPSIHGQDVAYTFYVTDGTNIDVAGQPVDESIATELQDYITSFAATGNPNLGSQGVREGPMVQFVVYGEAGSVEIVGGNDDGKIGIDPAHNDRCLWWQQALYS